MHRQSHPLGRLPVSLALMVAFSGCPKAPEQLAADSKGLYAQVQQAQSTRLAAIHDVDVEGQIVDPSGRSRRFRYAMQRPAFTAGEFLGPDGARLQAFVFDGKDLVIIDDASKMVDRQDLSIHEPQMLSTLRQVFSRFVCEGWRAPLLVPYDVTAVRNGDHVVVSSGGAQSSVAAQRLVLKESGAFVSKLTFGNDGAVLTDTVVQETATDKASGLEFPIRWSLLEGGAKATVTLSAWRVNQGVPPARFDAQTPAGYTEVFR